MKQKLFLSFFFALLFFFPFGAVHAAVNTNISVSPSTVVSGSGVSVSWSSSGAASCTGSGFSTGGATSGSVIVYPSSSRSYSVTCTGTEGTSGSWQYSHPDVIDLWCPVTNATMNLYMRHATKCSPPNPTGTSCSYTESWCSNWWISGCNIRIDEYKCVGASSQTVSDSDSDSVSVTSGLSVSCSVSPSSTTTGSPVTWSASASGGTGSYSYSWSGAVSGSSASETETYSTAGTKSGSVTVSSGSQSSTKSCGSVSVSESCTSSNICSGGNVVDSCTYDLIEDCSYGCSSGSCNPPPPPPSPECSDGIDNDGDGNIDLSDFGCSSGSDDSESPNPQCSDGIDNNGNGLIDLADTGACTSSYDGNEEPLPDASLSLSGQAMVRDGSSLSLSWSAENITSDSCTLSGTNGDLWSLVGLSGSESSSPITAQTTFTLTCLDLSSEEITTSMIVRIVPNFGEI